MAKQFEVNQSTFPKDYGEIVLYQRSDHKTPRWQTRIKINGAEHYIRKSTKTLDFNKALGLATELYLSSVDKFRATGLTEIKTFKQVVDEWLDALSKNPKTISEFKSRLYNYPVRLWGDLPIDRLQQSDLIDFMDWRRSTGAIRPNPSNVTIKRDLVPLRQVLKYAYGKKYTSQHLIFDTFKAQSQRRPAFSENEWEMIVRKLPEWVNQSIGHHRHFRDRFYLYKYVILIGYSGIRPGSEARSLTWGSLKSIDLYKNGGGQTAIEISRGKRGPRVAIPDQRIDMHLAELKTFRAGELVAMKRQLTDDEPIFCHENGRPIHSFKKGFRAFLENYNLLQRLVH